MDFPLSVHDPLYGAVRIPAWLKGIVLSPEFQRLRQIRLINTSSLSLPTLSDLRRYGHSLGVFALAESTQDALINLYGQGGYRTLVAATLLHDIGTAPFGHLFEYQLGAQYGWSHSEALREVLDGTHHELGTDSQLYGGKRGTLVEALDAAKLDPRELTDAVEGHGPLAHAISARLDLDNIDNVYRMALSMGIRFPPYEPVKIAQAYVRFLAGYEDLERTAEKVTNWQSLRSQVYEQLAFDYWTLASQAVLFTAISRAIATKALTRNDWILTDEDLVSRLLANPDTYQSARRFQTGQYYTPIALLWYYGCIPTVDVRDARFMTEFADAVASAVRFPVAVYPYVDRAALSRAVELVLPDGRRKSIGRNSRSTIVALFSTRSHRLTPTERRRTARIAVESLAAYGLDPSALRENVVRTGSLFSRVEEGFIGD